MTKDDKQLREAITEAADYHLPLVAIDRLTALFQKEQIQLVSELEGELPKKTLSGKPLDRAYNRAIDQMTWNLERKKQELEGKI